MGQRILKTRLKYAVLNKETQKIHILHLQKDVADLFGVDRKAIYRKMPYENSKYIVYFIASVP